MPHELKLTKLVIENFRALRHIHIPELTRVNIFVGTNNSGKTSLLDAVRLYLSRAPEAMITDLLARRNELRPGMGSLGSPAEFDPRELQWAVEAVLGLVWGGFGTEPPDHFTIASEGGREDEVRFSIPWLPTYIERGIAGVFWTLDTPMLLIERPAQQIPVPLKWLLRSYARMVPEAADIPLVPPGGYDPNELAFLWREAATAGVIPSLEAAVRAVVPELERLDGVGENGGVVATLRGTARPVPLASMGDGTARILGIALAFVHAREGVVLIDEVENGLHYSVQAEVWEAIFTMAERLGVQVFATTHSWEAVVGFQYAANRSSERGILYRLEREDDGRIYLERYTQEDVAIAAEQQIEVR